MLRLASLLSAALLVASCGQVVTRTTVTPSPTVTQAATPIATLKPTSTPAPYTPAPTSTPTLTPTPVIYTIQKGDNLMKIASQFGVSIRELQELNGIVDPRALRVGQELIVPNISPEEEGTPQPTATPMPFSVENVTFSNTPLGGLWAFGEIRNTNDVELEQATVAISLLDDLGAIVALAEAPVQVDLVEPGQRAPFALHFEPAPQRFSSYLGSPATGLRGYVGAYYRDLEALDLQGDGERYATYTVSGTIANVGPEDAVDVSVTVTIYDALGRVIGSRKAPPEHNVIPKGGRTSFAISLTPAGGPVASYRVSVLGRRIPTPTPPPG